MIIIRESPFVIGKIKVWQKPIYLIEELGQNRTEIKEIIEEELNCITDLPFYQKPRSNTILGSIHPTFRFAHISMLDKDIKNIVNHLNIGFGQNGYYYDIKLKNFKCTKNKWKEITNIINKLSENIEKSFEMRFNAFGYEKEIQDSPYHEISNLDITFLDGDNLIFNKFPHYKTILDDIKKQNESIVDENENLVFPELNFNIQSKLHYSNPILYQRSIKYLENERQISIRLVPPNENIWNISSRGIKINYLFEFINNLLPTIHD